MPPPPETESMPRQPEPNGRLRRWARRRRRRTRGLNFDEVGPPSPTEQRFVLAQAYDASDPVHPTPVDRAFRAGAQHLVQVQVGPERSDMRRAEGAPSIDEALPPDGTSHELVVVFRPSRGEEQSEQVTLAPTGPTRARR